MVADCYAALSPPDELWQAYLTEIDKLERLGDITRDDYEILRRTGEAEQMLMDITMGQPSAYVEGRPGRYSRQPKHTFAERLNRSAMLR